MAAIECSICTDEYDSENNRPLVGSCGHTICSACIASINNNRCPSCQTQGSFQGGVVNFQLLEFLESLGELRASHEEQIIALREEADTANAMAETSAQIIAINTASEERMKMELQNQCDLLSQMDHKQEDNVRMFTAQLDRMNKELEEKKKRIELLEKKEKRLKEIGGKVWIKPWKCSHCGESIDHSKARICVDCNTRSGLIKEKKEGSFHRYYIENMEEADARMLCASCCLDTAHREHKSEPYLRMKLIHRSHSDMSVMTASLQKVGVAKMNKANEDLLAAVSTVFPLMEKVREKASQQKNEMEYNRLMAKCGSIKRAMEGIARAHEETCGTVAEDLKQNIVSQLERVCLEEVNAPSLFGGSDKDSLCGPP